MRQNFSIHVIFKGVLFIVLWSLLCLMLKGNSNSAIFTSNPSSFFIDPALNNLDISGVLTSSNTYHVFCHGRAGELLIEGQWLSAQEIANWLKSTNGLKGKTALNIYGCEFAKGAKGMAAVNHLEKSLKVPVAASTNVTGVDGDWVLEVGKADLTFFKPIHYQGNLQDTFVCDNNVFMATSTSSSIPSQLYSLDRTTIPYSLSPVGAASGDNYNALGYREQDNYLYGIKLITNEVVRIGSDGVSTNLGAVVGLPVPGDLNSTYDSGDVFPDGYLYIHEVYNHSEIYQIDVTASPPVLVQTHNLDQNIWLSDFAYNSLDDKVYGVGDGGEKFMIDPVTWAVTTVGSNAPAGSYGAAYTNSIGEVFVYRNNPGALFQVDFGLNGTGTGNMTLIAPAANVTFNDGASCRGSFVISEICNNSIDDDLDGYIDCFDDDCPCYAPFTCDVKALYQTLRLSVDIPGEGVTNDFVLYRIDPVTADFIFVSNLTNAGLTNEINSIGFNPIDGFIYGIDPNPPYTLHRINANGDVTNLGDITGMTGLNESGTIDANGNYYVTGSSGNLYNVDVNTLTATLITNTLFATSDIAVSPVDGMIYGWRNSTDQLNQIDPATGVAVPIGSPDAQYDYFGAVYFNAQDELIAYGDDVGLTGNQETLAKINKSTGVVTRLGIGMETNANDGCSCSNGVELTKSAIDIICPGNTLAYTFTIYNRSGIVLNSVNFKDSLTNNLTFASNPYGATAGLTVMGNAITLSEANLILNNIPAGVSLFNIDVDIPDPYLGNNPFYNSASLSNLSSSLSILPDTIYSDDPAGLGITDPTATFITIEICGNGIDDDCDGLIDCSDDYCYDALIFNDDNDGDGIRDYCDLDDDSDGIPDNDEICAESQVAVDYIVANNINDAASDRSALINSLTTLTIEEGTIDNMLDDDFAVPSGIVRFSTDQDITNETIWEINYNADVYINLIENDVSTVGNLTDPSFLAIGAVVQYQYYDIDSSAWFNFTNQFTVPTTLSTLGGGTIIATDFIDGFVKGGRIRLLGISGTTNSDPIVRLENLVLNVSQNVVDYEGACDCDGDNIPNYLDLDSDNDGIYDVFEAGHIASDNNMDGYIDGSNNDSGLNGLFDGLETAADNGVLNYAFADSENIPDGIYDVCELDSDGDGCFDTEEQGIVDGDDDGIAGVGIPTVDSNGTISSLTYAIPLNNNWQNPLIGNCLPETCFNGQDNNANNLTGTMDWDCRLQSEFAIISELTCCSVCPSGDLIIRTMHTYGDNLIVNDPTNLAIGNQIFLSSRSFEYLSSPNYANDGVLDNNNIAITLNEVNPLLEVDLKGYFDLSGITIHGKDDCCFTTNFDYTIVFSETPFLTRDLASSLAMPGVNVYNHSQTGNAAFTIPITDRARFVRVFLNGLSQLQIKEIEITGAESTPSHPFQYIWSDASIGNTAEPTCLPAGIYTVTITDVATGVTNVESFTVN